MIAATRTALPMPCTLPPLRGWLWLVVASSSVVFVEPAPCDLLGAGLVVITLAAGQRVPRHLALPALLAGLFLFATLVASLAAPQPSASLLPFGIRSYLVIGWWLLLASLLSDRPYEIGQTIWQAWLLAAGIAAVAGILAFFELVPDDGRLVEQGRVRAFFKDPNVFGPFLVPPMLYLLLRLESVRIAAAIPCIVLFGTLALALVLGFSRGSWLNFAVALGVLAVLRVKSHRTRRERRRMLAAAAGLAVAAIAVIGAAARFEPVQDMLDLRAHFTQDYDVTSQVGGTKSRFAVQAETLQLAMARPLGIGAGQSEMPYNQGKAPHNLYLHTLVEGGWVGGLAFYALIALTLWHAGGVLFAAHPLQGNFQVAFAALLGLLSQSLFVDSTHWRHFYLLLALLWGTLQALRNAVASRDTGRPVD